MSLKYAAALAVVVATPALADAPDLNCDFEHQCYPATDGQTYHMDLAHPDRVTPPPTPQYAPSHSNGPQPPVVADPGQDYRPAPEASQWPSESRGDPWCVGVEWRLFRSLAEVQAAHARCDQ